MSCTPQSPKPIPPTVTEMSVLICLHRAYVDYLVIIAACGDEFPECCKLAWEWYCEQFDACLGGEG